MHTEQQKQAVVVAHALIREAVELEKRAAQLRSEARAIAIAAGLTPPVDRKG